jgi:hypothetical protein
MTVPPPWLFLVLCVSTGLSEPTKACAAPPTPPLAASVWSPSAMPLAAPEQTATPTPTSCGDVCDSRQCAGALPCPDGSFAVGFCIPGRNGGCECAPFECPTLCSYLIAPVMTPWGYPSQFIMISLSGHCQATVTGGARPITVEAFDCENLEVEVPLNPGLNELTVDILANQPKLCHSTTREDAQGGPLDILFVPPTATATPPPTTASPAATVSRTATASPTLTPAVPCVGDCSGGRRVAITDLITLVSIALGDVESSACVLGIPPGHAVDIAVIVRAVNNALAGCP